MAAVRGEEIHECRLGGLGVVTETFGTHLGDEFIGQDSDIWIEALWRGPHLVCIRLMDGVGRCMMWDCVFLTSIRPISSGLMLFFSIRLCTALSAIDVASSQGSQTDMRS